MLKIPAAIPTLQVTSQAKMMFASYVFPDKNQKPLRTCRM